MSSFVLIPGAGGVAWYWSRVLPILDRAGHQAVAVDLPGDDEAAGVPEYADRVLAAIRDLPADDDVVLVAQSLGGFTATLVATLTPVSRLVFVNAMYPVRGESAGAWWDATRSSEARRQAAEDGGYPKDFDLQTYFLHDVPPDVAAEGEPYQRDETDTVFGWVCDVDLPDIPRQVLVGADDRFFPAEFQRRLARERLGVDADLVPGGHLVALANPSGVADYLLTDPTG